MPEVVANPPTVKPSAPSSRERILFAGKSLFAQDGYENTSTVAIAREAGTSESQLMKHFGSKQGLLSAILERGWTSIMARVQALPAGAQPRERLFGMLEAIVIESENDLQLKKLMTLEARRVRKDSRDVLMGRSYQQYVDLMGTVLSDMRAAGQIRRDLNLGAVRSAFIGMIENLLRDQVAAERSELRAGYAFDDVRHLIEVLLLGLAGGAQPVKYANG